jgi:hypothetical protein
MKTSVTILTIVIGVALTAIAAPSPRKSSASNTAVKTPPPAKLAPAPTDKYKIERVGEVSSRSWTDIVGWHPGTSQFPDAENHEPQLVLLRIGF